MDEFPEINIHSYIGVIIAITGNILISVALNIQKYAHNQLLQPTANPQHDFKSVQPIGPQANGQHQSLPNRRGYDPDNRFQANPPESDGEVPECGYQSSRNSISSSRRGSDLFRPVNRNGDTTGQSDSVSKTLLPDGDHFYESTDGSSDMQYLRSRAWWTGMTLMILGECGNFLAYGYAQASIIAPLGTVALISNVILAPLILHESFRRRDLLGVMAAVIGTVVVVVNSKESDIQASENRACA
ncbi:hypothetical protein BGW38_004167 [Lunasporangiospora selenospora]|uniref:Uncharacterized protein n=1 Tax=Lunasporangiospora selenospora TaxID=979761 RepID=A0A9P6KHF7_9FUNG|nr:hypothetical protein BGW38_004167 [Lunasporangiospora selenospora]